MQAKRVVQSVRSFERDRVNFVYDPALGQNAPKSLSTYDEGWTENACHARSLVINNQNEEERTVNRCSSFKGVSIRGGLDFAEGASFEIY